LPVTTITADFQVLAREAGGNHGLNLFCCHVTVN
jgi:hypothetical protein